MDERHASRLEAAIDWSAAAVLAAAAAYAALRLAASPGLAGGAALAALGAGLLILRSIRPAAPRFTLTEFSLEAVPAPEEELLLTDTVAGAEPEDLAGELLLDDALGRFDDSARVVRLFDRSAMPTPGELKARIDRHLDASRAPSPDAAQALHEALAELRRTLR